jgi:large subunit ribosomal protein L17
MPGTRKLGKTTDQRMAMLRQQVTDFLDTGRMETTLTRAKEIAASGREDDNSWQEEGHGRLSSGAAFITREDVCKKLFDKVAPKYADRSGGYTRVTRTGVPPGRRRRDPSYRLRSTGQTERCAACWVTGSTGYVRPTAC